MPKIAVVDIGSNSIRTQISEIFGKSYKIIEDYKETLRIGDEVFLKGMFGEITVENILSVLRKIKSLIDGKNVDVTRVIATAAFREAKNGYIVADAIEKETGLKVEIISGEDEAYFNYLSAAANFQLTESDAVIVDIGGGSAEICVTLNGNLKQAVSTNLGCSKLTQMFIKHSPPLIEEVLKMKKYITSQLRRCEINKDIAMIICSGGTMYNVSEIYYKEKNKEDAAIKYVDRKFLKKMISTMELKEMEEIKNINGIELQRADIMLAAMMLIDILLEKTRLSGFYTLRAGLRMGLTIDTMNKIGVELPFQNGDDVRYSRLIEIGNKFSFEEDHARHVNFLAKKLFELLKDKLNLDNRYIKILEGAAILHDIGNYISYSSHHKHSYYLIKNSELLGYKSEEVELIANIARYHRRSVPKPSHEPYNNLGVDQKAIIRKLAGILRVADGLDRSHNMLVLDISIMDSDDVLYVKPISDMDIYIEIEGANNKKELLEEVLGKKVVIQ
jgi:exopolyphosphatase/guanosine-5'-triphosphate,3'-diphosphate pyrophosphatase